MDLRFAAPDGSITMPMLRAVWSSHNLRNPCTLVQPKLATIRRPPVLTRQILLKQLYMSNCLAEEPYRLRLRARDSAGALVTDTSSNISCSNTQSVQSALPTDACALSVNPSLDLVPSEFQVVDVAPQQVDNPRTRPARLRQNVRPPERYGYES